ncbi:hypothetical protein MMC27_002743 [Xylographa pallens]|nr:hypothetical protein [Xylographa pallens]
MHNAVADIILVHSMQGENWSPHEELYSKLFPEEQPAARVLIYGYDASLWRMTSAAGIEDAAKELLSELEGTSSKVMPEGIPVFYTTGD